MKRSHHPGDDVDAHFLVRGPDAAGQDAFCAKANKVSTPALSPAQHLLHLFQAPVAFAQIAYSANSDAVIPTR